MLSSSSSSSRCWPTQQHLAASIAQRRALAWECPFHTCRKNKGSLALPTTPCASSHIQRKGSPSHDKEGLYPVAITPSSSSMSLSQKHSPQAACSTLYLETSCPRNSKNVPSFFAELQQLSLNCTNIGSSFQNSATAASDPCHAPLPFPALRSPI